MRGLVLEGVRHITYRTDLPDPGIETATDAVVAVHRAGLCGSDLHPYEGREPALTGVVPGHEFVGSLVAVGDGVARFAVGDRVLAPFTTCCGACGPCRRGLTARCVHGQLFGHGPPDGVAATTLGGAQAEFVRVPLADATLVSVPQDIAHPAAILLTDNLPTAWEAVARAEPTPGDAIAIVGLGSVGLCAVTAAVSAGSNPVVGIDPVAGRRERARDLGADVAATPEEAKALLGADPDRRTATGSGVPAVVEAAGTAAAQRLAFDLVAPGGSLSIIAVQTTATFAFTPVEAYDRNVTVRTGRASVRATLEHLLPRVLAGEVTVPDAACVTHLDVPLAEGPDLYHRFAAREDGLVKALLRP